MKATKANLTRSLNRLGATPQEVAANLEEQGITGEPKHAQSCPVANYLKRTFPVDLATVSTTMAVLVEDEHRSVEVFTLTPKPVEDFIKAFDKGKYRQLRSTVPVPRSSLYG